MQIWFIFSIVALLLAYFSNPNGKLTRNYLFYQFALAIWLAWFSSFGAGMMQDHYGYLNQYSCSSNLNLFGFSEIIKQHLAAILGSRDQMEMGYLFVNVLFNRIGFSFVGFAFIYNILLNYFMVKFIYRFRYPTVIVMLFISGMFFSQQANLVRQMMAVSIFLYSTKYIVDKDLSKFFLAIFVGSLFHFSIIIVLPVYFFANKEYPRYILILIWMFSLLVFLNNQVFGISKFLNNTIIPYYHIALEQQEGVGTGITFRFRENVILFTLLIFKQDYWLKNRYNSLIFNLFFLGVVIINFVSISNWFPRIALYFTICSIIVLPQMLYSLNEKMRQNFKMVIPRNILFLPLILYLSFLLYSYAFRLSDTSKMLGAKMYSLSELLKN